jgi:hypothetical protein
MFRNSWKKTVVFGGAAALLALIATFTARPLLAQVKAALIQDVDSPARQPFQYTASLDVSGTSGLTIPIPTGKRLVVDFIAISGAGPSTGTQPYIQLYPDVAGSPNGSYTFRVDESPLAAQQFDKVQPVTIYADSLFVGLAFAGSTPAFLTFNVQISGHLIAP